LLTPGRSKELFTGRGYRERREVRKVGKGEKESRILQ
jgi:hypothetical protein